MIAGVYAITNTVTGKVYVGSSIDIRQRWSTRRSELSRGVSKNKLLQADWLAAGSAAFDWRILEVTERDNAALATAEERWIGELTKSDPGVYNQRPATVGRHGSHAQGKRRGWGWALGKRKSHYFLKVRSALCRNAVRNEFLPLEDDLHDSPDNCAACKKLYVRLPKRRHQPPRAALLQIRGRGFLMAGPSGEPTHQLALETVEVVRGGEAQ